MALKLLSLLAFLNPYGMIWGKTIARLLHLSASLPRQGSSVFTDNNSSERT